MTRDAAVCPPRPIVRLPIRLFRRRIASHAVRLIRSDPPAVPVQFASHLSILGFALTVFQGVLSGSGLETSMQRALITCVIFYGVGLFCGELAKRVIEESVDRKVAQERAELLGLPTESKDDSPSERTSEPLTQAGLLTPSSPLPETVRNR